MSKTIVWFRQDLRLSDNPALQWACDQGDILPIYIYDNTSEVREIGGASKWWLHHSLSRLNDSLDGKLQFFVGAPLEILKELSTNNGINTVVWNRLYEPETIARDSKIKTELKNAGLEVRSFNGSLLWEPHQVLKKDGTPYKVFSPYYRKGCLATQPRMPVGLPTSISYVPVSGAGVTLSDLNLLPEISWDTEIQTLWTPGEHGAKDKLQLFLSDAVKHYKTQRNLPAVVGTSRLSAHMHYGEISPNQVWYAASEKFDEPTPDLDNYLSELGWREFSYYLLYHWPTLPTENFQKKFDDFPWQPNDAKLRAWQKGQTGYPIVDAGMRELWRTGTMHNRVRMIVGSFLVKNLLQDWRDGEAWFWDCLLDADMASNSASWQWVAGSGADAAPYFRIFNPVSQGQKFDPDGEYVKTYCPELAKLPPKLIHSPWEAKPEILKACNVELGVDYPEPIVELKASRQAALDAFAEVKKANPRANPQENP